MVEFIAKYWLEVIFSLIIGILSYLARYFYKLYRKEQEAQKKELLDSIKEELKNYNEEQLIQQRLVLSSEDDKLQEAIKQVESSNSKLLSAVLEVQGKQFKNDCRQLLESKAGITYEQFDHLHAEFEIYKSLGGNGTGETLFDLVSSKYESQMMQQDQVTLLSRNFDFSHKPIIYPPPGYVLEPIQDKNSKPKHLKTEE